MQKKGLSHLLEPSFKLYFAVFAVFVAATVAMGQYALAAVEALVVLILFLYFRRRAATQRREIMSYIENISGSVDLAAKDTMVNAPLPMVIFRPESEEIIWSNDHFLQITGDRDHLFDRKITDAVPGFDTRWLLEGKTVCPMEPRIGERRFQVFGHLIRTEGGSARDLLATTYWVDVTELAQVRDEFYESRPVVALITLDSYDELFKGVGEGVKTAMLSDINRRLDEWIAPANPMLCRFERDRYLLVFEDGALPALQEGKFSILDQVRQVVNPSGLPATLSIGVGREGSSFADLFQSASLALEMALSRGGDQAVIKNRFNFDFYGGQAKETDRHTKVKSRVMAGALGSLMSDASQIFIMGHVFPDLDCVGPAAGLAAVARKRGVRAHIIRPTDPSPADGMIDALAELPEYRDVFLSPNEAILSADPSALLIVVDVNRPEQVLSRDLLEACNKVAVIDHHRRAASYIEGAALSYQELYASSTSELVTGLLQYLLEPKELLTGESDALLAGIVLDTKNFTLRTGTRTFEAAAWLRKSGAETTRVRKFFASDLGATVAKYEIIKEAQVYREGVAIAAMDHAVGRVTAAQAADELLTVSGIAASFVLYPADDGRIILSARSGGEPNVQLICEALGGGGNAAAAGAQIPGKSLEEACAGLMDAIDKVMGKA